MIARELRILFIPADDKQDCQVRSVADDWKSMGELVGGYFEVVRTRQTQKVSPRMVVIVNEEGLLKRLPRNQRATQLYPYGEGIVGDAFLVRETSNREQFTDLSPEIESFDDVLGRLRMP